MTKSKRRGTKKNFRVRPRHLREWARDRADMARDFFGTQTPLFAIAKSVERDPDLSNAVRRALSREFRWRVKFTNEIPRGWRCVALSVTAKASKCSKCGEPAKTLQTNFAFLNRGKVVPTPEIHATPAVCPTCGHVEEPEDPSGEAPKGVETPEESSGVVAGVPIAVGRDQTLVTNSRIIGENQPDTSKVTQVAGTSRLHDSAPDYDGPHTGPFDAAARANAASKTTNSAGAVRR